MGPPAVVLIPTHEHGDTLRHSVGSALAQDYSPLEVVIVGDGVDAGTRGVARELGEQDRVRFLDLPKGERHGEAHRHALLADSKAELVLYLSDDDIWLPGHVEAMRALLAEADFAHALPLRAETDGRVGIWPADLGRAEYRRLLLAGENRIPLSCAAHTLAAYRRLPRGWRPAPRELPTDLHMWQQWLATPGMRFASSFEPTTLHFPSPSRHGWTIAQRVEELQRWEARLREEGAQALTTAVLEAALRESLQRDLDAIARERQALGYHRLLRQEAEESARGHRAAAELRDQLERAGAGGGRGMRRLLRRLARRP